MGEGQGLEALRGWLIPLVRAEELDLDRDGLRADVVGREACLLAALAQLLQLCPDPQEQSLRRCLLVWTPLEGSRPICSKGVTWDT
jgi:hypothetical protein